LNGYFENNIRFSLKTGKSQIIIITKDDLFFIISIEKENIPSFIINNDNSIIE
jgi:hypothetical protein